MSRLNAAKSNVTDLTSDLLKRSKNASVISFDFFDTLYIRPIYNPEDAFDILGELFGIQNFRSLRRAAQTEAFQRMHQAGLKEISLQNIYDCFPNDLGVSPEMLVKAEYELELKLVRPNPELMPFFKELIAQGRKVVITSDMYLGDDFFLEALKRHGLPKVPLFVSSERNATKRDFGELYNAIISELAVSKESIFHIGDNERSDCTQAKKKGLNAFHYIQACQLPQLPFSSLTSSLAIGIGRTHYQELSASVWKECGFFYAGPAALGFLQWIESEINKDQVDKVLFISRDGYLMDKISHLASESLDNKSCYFYGSRIAFTLAAITESNFLEFIPFILSGGEGLSPFELLERIGVSPPSSEVMASLGLPDDLRFSAESEPEIRQFLYAYRWEILKVCQKNRRALFNYLTSLGIKDGQTIALVDIGWSGSTQEALELALQNLIDINVKGYYFCLVDTPERISRSAKYNMVAMFSSQVEPPELIEKIYANRVTIETLFSAPHHTVIGLDFNKGQLYPLEDMGRGGSQDGLSNSRHVIEGGQLFVKYFIDLLQQLEVGYDGISLARSIIDFAVEGKWSDFREFKDVSNFDTWASSRNFDTTLVDYT